MTTQHKLHEPGFAGVVRAILEDNFSDANREAYQAGTKRWTYNTADYEETALQRILAAHEAEADRRVLEELEALQVEAYHAPFNSPETKYDAMIKRRIAQLQPHTPTKEDV